MDNKVIEQSKNKNLIVGVVIGVIMLLVAALGYFLFIKKDKFEETVKQQNNQQVDKVLSNEEALSIAKEKLNSALNFWGNLKKDDNKDNIGEWFYYFDTLDNFKNKFYSIYSKQLTSKDVYEECAATLPIDINGKCQTNLSGGLSEDVASYAIKDNKVYVQNYCTTGDGFTSLKGDYEVKNVTADKIVVKYVLTQGDYDPTVKDNYDEEIVLIKEDNNWKIQNVTLIGVCNGYYEVGKSSKVNDIKPNNTIGLKNAEGNAISIDYSKLEQDLINKVQNGNSVINLQHCKNCEEFDYANPDKVKCENKKLKISSIKTFINKLKSADLVEYLPTSKECSEYTYTIGSDLTAFEANDKSILLVGINGNGYAFHFPNENIINFLVNLK